MIVQQTQYTDYKSIEKIPSMGDSSPPSRGHRRKSLLIPFKLNIMYNKLFPLTEQPTGSNSMASPGWRKKMNAKQKKSKMKSNLVILCLFLFPISMHAQIKEKCGDLIVVPKALYDSFQNERANLDAADREITRERGVLDDLQKKYMECETQPDVAAMIKEAEEALKTAEANRKVYADAFAGVDAEVREIIRSARGKPVGYRYLEGGYGALGRVVTMNFVIVDDKVTTIPTYYPLPDTATR